MTAYEQLLKQLPQAPKTWLITGVAGFIGSNLLETLLKLDQRVVGLDALIRLAGYAGVAEGLEAFLQVFGVGVEQRGGNVDEFAGAGFSDGYVFV